MIPGLLCEGTRGHGRASRRCWNSAACGTLEPVDVTGLVRGLAQAYAESLRTEGVVVQAGEEVTAVRGTGPAAADDGHLLNNAAQRLSPCRHRKEG
jgi:hypothetical protein